MNVVIRNLSGSYLINYDGRIHFDVLNKTDDDIVTITRLNNTIVKSTSTNGTDYTFEANKIIKYGTNNLQVVVRHINNISEIFDLSFEYNPNMSNIVSIISVGGRLSNNIVSITGKYESDIDISETSINIDGNITSPKDGYFTMVLPIKNYGKNIYNMKWGDIIQNITVDNYPSGVIEGIVVNSDFERLNNYTIIYNNKEYSFNDSKFAIHINNTNNLSNMLTISKQGYINSYPIINWTLDSNKVYGTAYDTILYKKSEINISYTGDIYDGEILPNGYISSIEVNNPYPFDLSITVSIVVKNNIANIAEFIKDNIWLSSSPLAEADESELKSIINGGLLGKSIRKHIASNDSFTVYFISRKYNREYLNSIDIGVSYAGL